MLGRLVLWAVVAILFSAAPARTMTFVVADGGSTIKASGIINPGDQARLAKVLSGAGTKSAELVIDSPGGFIVPAADMADAIHARGMRVVVHGECASSCFVLLLAGRTRAAVAGSQVGVHSASCATCDETEDDSTMASTVFMARKAIDLGASASSIVKLITTPPSRISWLTDDDLRSMNVQIVPTAP